MRPEIFLAWVLLVVLLIPLAGHAYLGTFTRRMADDYCTAATLRRLGFWASQVSWYRDWSGRFSFTFVVNLIQLSGPWLARWLPGLAVGLWLTALIGLMRRVRAAWPPGWARLAPAAAASLALFLTLRGTPSPYQSLYWLTGMLTYSLPLVLATAYAAWLARKTAGDDGARRAGPAAMVVAAAIPFVAGGFSETYVSAQTVGLGIGLLAAGVLLRGARRAAAIQLLSAGLLGSALAMVVLVLAPGNDVRRSFMPPSPDAWSLVQHTVHDAYIFVYQVAKYQTLPLVLAVSLPVLLGVLAGFNLPAQTQRSQGGGLALIFGIPATTALLTTVAFAPSEYALSSYPDGRVLITQQYVLFAGIVLWAAAVGERIGRPLRDRPRPARALVLALFAAGIALAGFLAGDSLLRIQEQSPIYREFAATWDDRDARLQDAARLPGETVAVPSLRHMGDLAEIGDDPEEWINVCVAEAYDVDAVVAK